MELAIFGFIFAVFPLFMATLMGIGAEADMLSVIYVFTSIFFVVGCTFLRIGLTEVITNRRTSKKGVPGYGRVMDVEFTGMSTNDKQISEADVKVYVPSLNIVTTVVEKMGIDKNEFFPMGETLTLMYYEGDISDMAPIDMADMPEKAQEALFGKVMISSEKGDRVNVDTSDWTLSEEAFPDDMNFNRSMEVSPDILHTDNSKRRGIPYKPKLIPLYLGIYAVLLIIANFIIRGIM